MTNQYRTIESATSMDREAVTTLWARCGLVRNYNPPEADFDAALGKPSSDILVLRLTGTIVGSTMVGHDGHRGWMYYLSVDPDHQQSGFGQQLVRASEDWLIARGQRKLQLMVRETNQKVLGFYEHLGFERSPVTVMQRWLDDTVTS